MRLVPLLLLPGLALPGCTRFFGVYAEECPEPELSEVDGGSDGGGAESGDTGEPACEGLELVLAAESPDEAAGDDLFGYALATGNLAGRGGAEVAVGAPYVSDGAVGAVYVVDYAADEALRAALSLDGSTDGTDFFGYALAVTDVDGDEIDDLLVGAPRAELAGDLPDAGRTFFWYGPLSGTLTTADADFSMTSELSTVGSLGWDVDIADLQEFRAVLAGAPALETTDPDASGAVLMQVVDGAVNLDDTKAPFARLTATVEAKAGWDLATGDFDGDGLDDLALTAVTWKRDDTVGAIVVIDGALARDAAEDGAGIDLDSDRETLVGSSVVYVGMGLAAGDLDLDGRADLYVGVYPQDLAPGLDDYAGFVVDVATGGNLVVPGDHAAALVDETVEGYYVAGRAVGELGRSGQSYLWAGRTVLPEAPGPVTGDAWLLAGPLSGTVDLDSSGCAAEAPDGHMLHGNALAGGEDVTGDGQPDLIAGAPWTGEGRGALSIFTGCCE